MLKQVGAWLAIMIIMTGVMVFGILSKAESQERQRIEKVKAFCIRGNLENPINDWLEKNPQIEIIRVTQNGSSGHNDYTIVIIWYR